MNLRKAVATVRGVARAKGRSVMAAGLGLAISAIATGCHTIRQTDPPRTATEELLVTTAAERALTNEDFSWSRGRRVFVDDKYFESYDRGFAVSMLRQRIAASGGMLTATNDKADIVVEIRSAALSINSSDTLFGIPNTAAPIPLAGSIALPEVAIYKSVLEDSVAKFALFVYDRESGNFVSSQEPIFATATYHRFKLLGISWKKTDVPELKKKIKTVKQD